MGGREPRSFSEEVIVFNREKKKQVKRNDQKKIVKMDIRNLGYTEEIFFLSKLS